MADECSSPPLKKSKLENCKNRRPYFQRVHKKLINHKTIICEALKQLNSDWASFCFVKILNCNADEPCSFSLAYCKTLRNLQEDNPDKRGVVWIPDLFNTELVQMFLDMAGDIENQITDKQLTALKKLATFLDTISDTNRILKEQLKDRLLKEGRWATVLGTHVLKKLAVSDEMKIDSGYSKLPDDMECPCGCKSQIRVGDNSMGHEEVWHGSVDILIGPVAIAATSSGIEEGNLEEGNSAFELKRGKLEDARHQLVPESIIFAFAMHNGVVPLVGISKEDIKIFMYDPDEDLLYESTELPLFVVPMPLEGRQLHISSLVALWIIINYDCFCTGVKSSHVEFGYKANLQKFLGKHHYEIYQHHIRMGGLKHVKSDMSEYKAGGNIGKFKRI